MNIDNVLYIVQIVSSIIIVTLVLLQQQDSGFYANNTNARRTRRGTEKLIYNLTVLFGVIFVVTAIINLVV